MNADSLGVLDETQECMNGLNLYSYCLNNPVNMIDENGQIFDWINRNIVKPIGNAVNAIGNAVVSAVNTVGNMIVGAANAAYNWICDNWEIIVGAAIIIGLGVAMVFTSGLAAVIIAGAFYGSLSSAGIGALIGYATGGWEGAASGFMWGAITGAALGGIGAGASVGIKSALAGRSVLFAGSKAASSTSKVVDGSKWAGKSWTTVRKNYWKEQAATPGEWFGNQRAARGLAPLSRDGSKMILHHPLGREGANLYKFIPMSMKEHKAFHSQFGRYFYDGVWNLVRKLK